MLFIGIALSVLGALLVVWVARGGL
jgi:hypothetical protein